MYIKQQTQSTAGNLSVQLEKLAEAGYVTIEKGFAGKKPRTTCCVTEKGKEAFAAYVDALRDYLKL